MSQGQTGPDGLNPDDPGVRLLGKAVAAASPKALLLVHCGEIPGVGPGATRLILDVREAGESVHRCVSSLAELDEPLEFDHALVWPRAHLGKDFSEFCLAQAALAVREGGTVLCAARKQKGGKSLAKMLERFVGNVEVVARDRGYHLFEARRGPDIDEQAARDAVDRRYHITDPAFGDGVELDSAPGVFSRLELDAGTRALIAVADATARAESNLGEPGAILDLCAGVGPLALWGALRWPKASVLAVESNLRACACLRATVARLELEERITIVESDGLPTEGFEERRGRIGLALVNPPTHADRQTLVELLTPLRTWLAPGRPAMLVVNRPGHVVEVLRESGAKVRGGERDGYVVLEARW